MVLWEAEGEVVGKGARQWGMSPNAQYGCLSLFWVLRERLPAAWSTDKHPGGVMAHRYQMKEERDSYWQPWPSDQREGTAGVQSWCGIHSIESFELKGRREHGEI